LYGQNETLLWRNMYVLSQYALGNDQTPDAKRMMQTLNLAMPDGRGMHHNATTASTMPTSTVAGAAGMASGGGKAQRPGTSNLKAFSKVKPGDRFPETAFFLGGVGTLCHGPCHECGENTHHKVECPKAFFKEWNVQMPGFLPPLGHGAQQSCEEMRDPNYFAPGGQAYGPSDMVLRQWVLHEWDRGDHTLKDQVEGRATRRRSFWPGWEEAWKKFS